MAAKNVGTNVELDMDGDILLIRIDLSAEHGVSGSGKSIKVASTNGNLPVPFEGHEGKKIGLNVYKPKT